MKPEDMRAAMKLLFENFWIIRSDVPEDYLFLRRHHVELRKELRQRLGLHLIMRPQYIQVLKRPHQLDSWMGEISFTSQLDYALFCCGMAYVEGLEAETPFMLDELIRDLDLSAPEELAIDWTNYNHRKSLIRVIKKMIGLRVIETIQGEAGSFEQAEENQEVLFSTTILARAFLSRAPQSYSQYETFAAYWEDVQANRKLEGNQVLYQRLMMEGVIQRTTENEESFIRLKNYYRLMKEYIENATYFNFELYRDYAALTLEERDNWPDIFPSRKVIDEVLIQLATIIRTDDLESSPYGLITYPHEKWQTLVKELRKNYAGYWSKELRDMTVEQLGHSLLARGEDWQLLSGDEGKIIINPVFGRLIAEMRNEDD